MSIYSTKWKDFQPNKIIKFFIGQVATINSIDLYIMSSVVQ